MSVDVYVASKAPAADKAALLQILDDVDARAGIVFDPDMTAERLDALMQTQRIRPEDNIFSRDILRARYEEA